MFVGHGQQQLISRSNFALLPARARESSQFTLLRPSAAFRIAVLVQIVADVPLCSLLSGGLDSSSVTAMAHRAIAIQHGGRIRSFSVDFADHGAAFVAGDLHKSSDTPFVRDFVDHVGSDHTEVVLDSREL
jgi:asparagine synthase (glutamine-hydrolysing)